MSRDWSGVAVVAPITVPYVRSSEHEAPWWVAQALRALVRTTGLAKRDIDGLSVASFSLPPDTAATLLPALGMEVRWLDQQPTGGASGVIALRRAARAVQAGDAELVACVAADAHRPGAFAETMRHFSRAHTAGVAPHGAGGPNTVFALITDHWMRTFGTTREDFGHIAVAQRANAARNPNALLRTPTTLADYLAARSIAPPLHLLDCVMPCAGAEGFLVTTVDRARALGLPRARIAAAVERHNAYADDPVMTRCGLATEAPALWAQAGVGPDAIDCVQTYDDYPVAVCLQVEDLGFCAKGEGHRFLRDRTLTFDGTWPHNTGGGQLSGGQAGAAGGYVGMTEALRQLAGAAGDRQVLDARRALVSGFGIVAYDRCVATGAVVLERGT
jgi:acetyl-CoA acetyltransferase